MAHFACAVIYREKRREGEYEILVQTYTPQSRQKREPQEKFPGGMQREGETPFKAMKREVREETGLIIERAQEVCRHQNRVGFLVDIGDCVGILRTKPIRDGNTDLSTPRWVNVVVLKRGGLFPSHHEIFLAALRELNLLHPRS